MVRVSHRPRLTSHPGCRSTPGPCRCVPSGAAISGSNKPPGINPGIFCTNDLLLADDHRFFRDAVGDLLLASGLRQRNPPTAGSKKAASTGVVAAKRQAPSSPFRRCPGCSRRVAAKPGRCGWLRLNRRAEGRRAIATPAVWRRNTASILAACRLIAAVAPCQVGAEGQCGSSFHSRRTWTRRRGPFTDCNVPTTVTAAAAATAERDPRFEHLQPGPPTLLAHLRQGFRSLLIASPSGPRGGVPSAFFTTSKPVGVLV